jgi:hypothetical protein
MDLAPPGHWHSIIVPVVRSHPVQPSAVKFPLEGGKALKQGSKTDGRLTLPLLEGCHHGNEASLKIQ